MNSRLMAKKKFFGHDDGDHDDDHDHHDDHHHDGHDKNENCPNGAMFGLKNT